MIRVVRESGGSRLCVGGRAVVACVLANRRET